MSKRFLRILNGGFSALISLLLIVSLLYSCYALWDNGQIYASAESMMEEARDIRNDVNLNSEKMEIPESSESAEVTEFAGQAKEETEETELQGMFRRLREINPDICAWINMQGTAIDYPVVHSSNNIDYVSTDIYGKFAIVGSIFLDFRNNIDSTDTYNLLYGHNMSEHRMFSDINLYKEEEFFNEHHRGAYYTPDGSHWLETISIILTHAGNSSVFNPLPWEIIDYDKLLELVQNEALFVNETGLNALKAKIDAGENPKIVALSTCSNEFTDARTILLTLMDPDNVLKRTGEELTEEEKSVDQEAER